MASEKHYGIVMNKIEVTDGVCIYIPDHLVEGTVYFDEFPNSLFTDIYGDEYLFMNDVENVFSQGNVVFDAYSEKEMLENYDSDIEIAKIMHFDRAREKCHIGFYLEELHKMMFINLDVDMLHRYFNSSIIETEDGMRLTDDSLPSLLPDIPKHIVMGENCSSFDEGIYFPIEEMESLLKMSPDKIRESLKGYYENYNMLAEGDELQSQGVDSSDAELKEKDSEKIVSPDDNLDIEIFDVCKMKEFFDKRIIGQDQAKEDVISALYMNSLADNEFSKNTCLLIGPTGSGKTLIAETASKYLNLPCVSIDVTQLSVPGYKGADIEEFLARLITVACGDVARAQRGIVILDEIDKKGSEKNDDISGRGVLNTLLPFIQGTTYKVNSGGRVINFDTSMLTIFATGAFTDVANQVKTSDYSGNNIGYNANINTNSEEDIKYRQLEIEDLVKYGNIPVEFLGRVSAITQLSGHTKESLKQILINSDISVLELEKKKLEKIGINLTWNDEYLDEVIDVAIKLKTGARSLKASVENSIKKARWEVIYSPSEFSGILLNRECVKNPSSAIVMYKDGNYTTALELEQKRKDEKKKVLKKAVDNK